MHNTDESDNMSNVGNLKDDDNLCADSNDDESHEFNDDESLDTNDNESNERLTDSREKSPPKMNPIRK